jgi:polar amino acid transport system substrate-binding protein
MKYTTGKWLFIGFLSLSTAYAAAECKRPLKAGWEYWPPYQYLNKQDELDGLDIELLKAIAKEADCTIHFYERPWKRHLLQIQRGQIDLAMGASFDKARSDYAYFSQATRQERVSLIVLESQVKNYHITSLSEITQIEFNLGATRGYYYGEEYKKLMNQAAFKTHVEEMHNDQINYNKLFLGRINGFLADPISMIHQLSSLQEKKPLSLLFDVNNADVHLMFSKKSIDQDTVGRFDAALERIRASGEYKKIMDKYLSLDDASNKHLQAFVGK